MTPYGSCEPTSPRGFLAAQLVVAARTCTVLATAATIASSGSAHAETTPPVAPPAPACTQLDRTVAAATTLDLSADLCVAGTAPDTVTAAGPGTFAGTTFTASSTVLGTATVTLGWTAQGAQQQLVVQVVRARPGTPSAAVRCSAAGTCRVRARVVVPGGIPVPPGVVELDRRWSTGRWRSYSRIPLTAGVSNAVVQVSAGTYRIRVRTSGTALLEPAAAPVTIFRQPVIQGRDGTWPVAPVTYQHPVRNAFMDARETNYHHGVDVYIDDGHPDPSAAPWASHRVFAVRSGSVGAVMRRSTSRPSSCSENVLAVGSQIYYHVVATVGDGQPVMRGQQIGWSCRGRWHVHLTDGFGSSPRNPVRPGAGLLTPYLDDTPPAVSQVSAWSPCDGRWRPWTPNSGVLPAAVGIPPCGHRLDPLHLRGLVDVRFLADDTGPRFPELDERPWMQSPVTPYGAHLRVDRLDARGRPARRVFDRDVFQSSSLAGQPPLTVHWAPGFRRWLPLWQCARQPRSHRTCAGADWFRAFATPGGSRYLDTRTLTNGDYRISITAWDATGNRGAGHLLVHVQNATGRTHAAGADDLRIEQPDPPGGPTPPSSTTVSPGAEADAVRDGRAWFGAPQPLLDEPE